MSYKPYTAEEMENWSPCELTNRVKATVTSGTPSAAKLDPKIRTALLLARGTP